MAVVAKAPWWLRVRGGREAANRVRNFGVSRALRESWMIANRTRLRDNPELASAVMKAGMDYGLARRLDIAFQAHKARKQSDLAADAGYSPKMTNPLLSQPTAAQERAEQDKSSGDISGRGFLGGLAAGFLNVLGVKQSPARVATEVSAPLSANAATGDVPWWQDTLESAGAVAQSTAEFAGEVGKNAVQGAMYGLGAVASPIVGPIAAGSASSDAAPAMRPSKWAIGPVGQIAPAAGAAAVNLVTGVTKIAGGVDDPQKEDMRRAGFDPDSWVDRYHWYGNYSGDHDIVSNRAVQQLKGEGVNPYKVDLVREILTTGVDDEPARRAGLSPDAQRMLADIQANKDPEGSEIMRKLYDQSAVTLGGHLADSFNLELGSPERAVVATLGDLAGYWYLDPLVVGGKAKNAWRNARFAIDMEPEAIKAAVATPGTTLSRRWDDALDRVDRIHVLSTSKNVEDQARAAQEFTRFQQVHADMVPFYDLLAGMRSGGIKGSVFQAPPKGAKFRDDADFRRSVLGIERVTDPAQRVPVFELRKGIDDEVTQETRDAARAEIADRIGDAILANAVTNGRPIVNNQLLMPGQYRFLQPIRNGLSNFTQTVLGQQGKLLDQLRAAEGQGVIDFTKSDSARAATAEVVDSARGGQWIRENYTFGGMRDRLAMTFSRFAQTKDAPVLHFDGMDSTKTVHDFARFFMPRGQAAFVANQWANADPAARSVMWGNLVESLANARHAKDSKAGVDFWSQQLKGREMVVPRGENAKEAYSSPDLDMIETPSGNVPAAMYSTQFAEGTRIPSFVDVLRNTEKIGVLSAIAGWSHSRFVTPFTRVTKVGQVGTTSNMLRQTLEGRALQALDDPTGAAHTTLARIGLSARTAAERVAQNEMLRQARILRNEVADQVTPLIARQASDELVELATNTLSAKGQKLSPALEEVLKQLRDPQDFAKLTRARSAARLASTKYAIDPLRKLRIALVNKTPAAREDFEYDWLDRVDDEFANRLVDGVHRVLGGQRAHYMDGGMVDELEQVNDGLQAGQRLAKVKLTNTQGYLGVAGDVGAQRWANALGLRLADPVGARVLQAVAREALIGEALETQIIRTIRRAEAVAKKRGAAFGPAQAAAIDATLRGRATKGDDPVALARELLTKGDEGETYRLHGRRGQYLAGQYVGGTPDQEAALGAWAEQMVEDARRYLGVTEEAMVARVNALQVSHKKLLGKVATGKQVTHDDLAKIGEDFRPEQVHSPVVVGRSLIEGDGAVDKLTNMSAKLYDFVVARPLQRLVHDPQVVAAHREVMTELEPLAKALNDRGMSADSIYNTLDTLAYGHAIKRVTSYSDNPNATSYFASLSNNLLWYERAMEDFARRFINIAKADPAKVARAALLAESAHHAGLIHKQKTTDDNGVAKTEYVFTWPGSGLAMRAVNETAAALGLVDDTLVRTPIWQDWTSPVQYLSPSLQNPLGFTTSPLLGMPMRAVRSLFPETAPTIDNVLMTMEGGERSFGSQSIAESLMPVYVRRVWNAMDQDDRDSQMASATKNALIYLQAAGQLPPADAPAVDRQRALDDVKTMVQNNLIWRTIFATFSPATPSTMGSDISGIGEGNEFDRLRGVNTIRGEWFQLLEDMSKVHADSSQAFSAAASEWMKRDHGSIINPAAFTVGSAGAPGWDTGSSFPSNMKLTQWMLDNKGFLEAYGQAAYAMLPNLDSEYYDQVGYRTQLRTDLRQHKDAREFYEDLVIAQTRQDYFAARKVRAEMLKNGSKDQANDWFNNYVEDLKRSNPVWAEAQNEFTDPEYISANIAPAVARMATATDLPQDLRQHQPDLRVLAKLYDDYLAARGRHNSPLYKDVQARKELAKRYNDTRGQLFDSTPLKGISNLMRVWED